MRHTIAPFGLVAFLALALPAGAQTFQIDTGQTPQDAVANSSFSENVDFADVDLDGDWDAVFADGGDGGNDQNRIWINQGGLQGGTLGVFLDETAIRLPAVTDSSRDVEFADIDGDGDVDLHVSNHSTFSAQASRFWINQGGAQAGMAGFFADETATRWVGLGGAGSSIDPALVLGSGGFSDFSADTDFADLDNDGDLDLVHSSYGAFYGGQVPTRIFLNDGAGSFSEFNPSGFQLGGPNISNGDPGLWCEGIQQASTVDATGAECDVASSAVDIDLGDVDGDLDLDLLHGARQELPRFFLNRLEENGGVLGFRDVTGSIFPAGYSVGDGHYEQEMGDLDGDGDLDLYGVNWRFITFSFTDVTLENVGGTFANRVDMTGSSVDDEEADFVDHDGDGDLDVFVAAFTSQDRLYRNTNDGGAVFGMVNVTATEVEAGAPRTARDVDAADVDADGDYDVWIAADKFIPGSAGRNTDYRNTSQVADTHAPVLFALEQAPNRSPGPEPTVVRVQVYDNAPYYATWYAAAELEITVGDGVPFTVPMRSSGGQIFRGEIPGGLVGAVAYRARSTDEHGNVGTTGELVYLSVPASFCDATDGALASCPCANPGNPDTGCDNAQGTGGLGLALLAQTFAPNGATLVGTGYSTMGSPASVVIRAPALDPSSPVPFGDGLRCISGAGVVRLAATTAVGGTSTHVIGHGAMAGPGTFHYQLWYRNTPTSFCTPGGFNLSNGRTLVW